MKGRIWKVRWNLAWKIMAEAKCKCSSNKDILLYKVRIIIWVTKCPSQCVMKKDNLWKEWQVGIGGGRGVPARKGVETWGTSRQILKQTHNRHLFITFEAHWVIMIIFYKRNWSQCFSPEVWYCPDKVPIWLGKTQQVCWGIIALLRPNQALSSLSALLRS